MKTLAATMVRIYLTEEKNHLDNVLKLLHDQGKVRGVTVFRGIAGFGKSGVMHSSTLVNMSLDLPVVIEFFDEPDKARQLISYLNTFIEPGHIVSWPAEIAVNDKG